MICIYVLELAENKYYVGKTSDIKKRLEIHFQASDMIHTPKTSLWTALYKPIKVYQIYENMDEYDEDKITLKLMHEKGIDNVRGGSFSQIFFTNQTKDFIQKMFSNSNNKCYFCGSEEHFIKNCPIKHKFVFQKPNIQTVCCTSLCGCLGSFINPFWGTYIGSIFGSCIGSIIHSDTNIDTVKYDSYVEKTKDNLSKTFNYIGNSIYKNMMNSNSIIKTKLNINQHMNISSNLPSNLPSEYNSINMSNVNDDKTLSNGYLISKYDEYIDEEK
jgi:hypothetical protein